MRPAFALSLLAAVSLTGAVAARVIAPPAGSAEASAAIPPALRENPNVILVMVDTLRADYLSCFGGPVPTPNLCALSEGRTFSRANWQVLSHASHKNPPQATSV